MITISDLRSVAAHLSSALRYSERDVDLVLDYIIRNSFSVSVKYHFKEPVLFNMATSSEYFWYQVYEIVKPSND